jgi:hypothetical protein
MSAIAFDQECQIEAILAELARWWGSNQTLDALDSCKVGGLVQTELNSISWVG